MPLAIDPSRLSETALHVVARVADTKGNQQLLARWFSTAEPKSDDPPANGAGGGNSTGSSSTGSGGGGTSHLSDTAADGCGYRVVAPSGEQSGWWWAWLPFIARRGRRRLHPACA